MEKLNDKFAVNACLSGNISLIEEYLKNDHDVNQVLSNQWTLLLYAASYAQSNLIQYLLNVGANPNSHYDGFTPLMALCHSTKGSSDKRFTCLKYLIEGKANVNATSKLKETALMYACKFQEIDFITELLKFVDEIDFADNEQRTALFYAVTGNRYDIVKLLIDKGADINYTNYRGISAYDIAVTKEYDKLIPLLINDGNYDKHEIIKINSISSWLDMFPVKNYINKDSVDSDVAIMLYGMGLESYKSCFRGVTLNKFLKLKEKDLIKLGIDISVHRKRLIDELLRFHKHEWNNKLMKIDLSQSFTPFEAIKILGNINKQLVVISSSMRFAKNYLYSIENNTKLKLTKEDNDHMKEQIKDLQEIAIKIKNITFNIKKLAKAVNDKHADLSLPIHIKKKDKNDYKWIITTIATSAGIYYFEMNSIKKFWKNTQILRNFFSFSLFN